MASAIKSSLLVFFVNGKKIVDENVDPEWTLLFYLRNKLRLCGTKLGCGEGGCGACTVMVSKYHRKTNKIIHVPVNACLVPICSMHGLAVTTVEGIGSTKTKLHPVQERIAKAHGSQCGFCTPGFVMSMYTLLRNSSKPSMKDLEIAFQGNLCRCTGYRSIVEGYKTFTEEWEILQTKHKVENGNGIQNGNGCPMGDQCCKFQNGNAEELLFDPSEFAPHDSSQEPIFPPELKLNDEYDKEYLIIKGKEVVWYRPTTLSQLLDLKQSFPHAKIVAGNTEIGVEVKFKNMSYPVLIQPTLIPEMIEIKETDNSVRVGSSVTYAELEEYLKGKVEKLPENQTRLFRNVLDMLKLFAGKQIRSVSTLGGNIMTGSPISDMIPILMANETVLELQSKSGGLRKLRLDEKFIKGYRQTIVDANEILLAIHLPYTNENRYCYAYKQARRRDDDIAIVNTAVNVVFEPSSDIIEKIRVVFGGMSFKPVVALILEKSLKGLHWNRETLEQAYSRLLEDLPLEEGAPGGMVAYRRSLSLSLFFKAFLAISADLHKKVDQTELSAISDFSNKIYKSSQYFTVIPKTEERKTGVHLPIIHNSAFKQATGEAVYCDDIPFLENQLYLSLVYSTKAHAKILSIDPSEALLMEGVHTFISAKDIKEEKNTFGLFVKDEKLFYNDIVTSQGQIIGGVVAINQLIARKAAQKVTVEYEELQPIIISSEDAIKHSSFLCNVPDRILERGNVAEVFKTAPNILEDQVRTGGQEHFYLETQSVVVVPRKEDDELEVFSPTQDLKHLALLLSELFDIDQNKVIIKTKRLGGAFGGKETKSHLVAIPAAIAAVKLNRPIRCMLDRDEDIVMTGGRHPSLIKYKVAYNNEGKILALDMNFFLNCGYSVDFSAKVLQKAMQQLGNTYNIQTFRANGYLCKTNLPSNTAFRAFGAPQGLFAIETIMQSIADRLKKDPVTVRELNLIKENDLHIVGQKFINSTMDKCWKECLETSNYYQRRNQIEEFNKLNRYKKRGLSVIPTQYGIGFNPFFLNQAGALILVYTDGSVLLSHGGVEMGQGLHTKMIQIASEVLEISSEKIHTVEVSTDRVPNSTTTAGSTGSDLNGMAVLNACQTIKDRLRPYKESNPKATWEECVQKAYFDRVSLSATGFYATPDVYYDEEKKEGNMYNYFTFGVACSEVEIDTLTGDHQVRRIDIVMDVGESLNPAIDIGQIEGAFIQGYGLFVLEELVYSPSGTNYTRGPGMYKIPTLGDIPGEFNVSILKGVSNPRAVYSSKGVGEAPLFLGSSVLFAIQDAVRAARVENGIEANIKLDAPATAAVIRMACQDNITAKIKNTASQRDKTWNIIP